MWKVSFLLIVLVGCVSGRLGGTRDQLGDRCADASHDCAVCVFTGTPRDECRICNTYDDFCKDRKEQAEAKAKDEAIQQLGLKSWPTHKDEDTEPNSDSQLVQTDEGTNSTENE